jgi:hypothetical protein
MFEDDARCGARPPLILTLGKQRVRFKLTGLNFAMHPADTLL